MTIPGFTAEASAGPAAGLYHGAAVFDGSGTAGQVSLQAFIGRRWFPGLEFRCCGWDCIPGVGCYFRCVTCRQRPGYHCECIPNFPGCTCRPQELAPF